jgi:hypothetical protein
MSDKFFRSYLAAAAIGSVAAILLIPDSRWSSMWILLAVGVAVYGPLFGLWPDKLVDRPWMSAIATCLVFGTINFLNWAHFPHSKYQCTPRSFYGGAVIVFGALLCLILLGPKRFRRPPQPPKPPFTLLGR